MPHSSKRKSRTASRKPKTQLVKQARFTERYLKKKEPSRQIRFPFSAALSSAALSNSWFYQEPANISSGTQLNQKTYPQIYVAGVKVDMTLYNTHSSTRLLRVMIVQAKNPNDSLDLTAFTDLFETTSFSPRTPDALSGDANAPINTDVVRVICDKRYIIAPGSDNAKTINFWCPIRKKIEYKTVLNNSAVSNGRLFMIAHVCEINNSPTANNLVMDGVLRVYYSEPV